MRASCLVLGGGGFVGSALVRGLLAKEMRVVSIDNYAVGSGAHLVDLTGNVEVIEADVLDKRSFLDLVVKCECEYLINCVGDTFVPECYDKPGRFFDINLMGCLNALEAARKSHVKRVVYVSSTEVYGDAGAQPLSETCALLPVNTYAVSKLAADRLCYTYSIEHGLSVVIARIFNCYGPRATHAYIIPELIRQISRGDVVYVGNLESERDFTFVDDTVDALIRLLVHPGIPSGDVVNIGTGQTHSVGSLVKNIAQIMGRSNVRVEQDVSRLRRRDISCFCCNNTKLAELTGWTPSVTFDEGLRRTVNWYVNNGRRWHFESNDSIR